MNCERTIFHEMKIPLKWKTCTRYCVSTCTNTCTSTYPIFAIANLAKCNGPFYRIKCLPLIGKLVLTFSST